MINEAIHKDGSIFKIVDRKKDISINVLARDIIEDKKKVIGPGEYNAPLCQDNFLKNLS